MTTERRPTTVPLISAAAAIVALLILVIVVAIIGRQDTRKAKAKDSEQPLSHQQTLWYRECMKHGSAGLNGYGGETAAGRANVYCRTAARWVFP